VATISDWLNWGQQTLATELQPELEASILLAHAMQVSSTYLRIWPERDVAEAQAHVFQQYCQRRQRGEPIAYILGEWAFWSLKLRVTPDTLIPRPETEHLVEWVLQHFADKQVLSIADLGTGSGAIALALASEKPQWRIVATDKSNAALTVARENAQRLKCKNVEWYWGSWFEPLAQQQFDCIISNPPYIDPQDVHLTQGDLRFEPIGALASDDAGMADLAYIIQQASTYLSPAGYLVLEHGYQQAQAVTALMRQYGWVNIQTYCDYAGHQRFTIGKLASRT
jgi:release factor glutamine methyltransferase